MSKHYITKYSSKQLKAIKAKKDASKRRANMLGAAASVNEWSDVERLARHDAEIANQLEQWNDVLFA